MTAAQEAALRRLCDGYHVPFVPSEYSSQFDLPSGYVAGWVGPIYVGVSPEGEVSS